MVLHLEGIAHHRAGGLEPVHDLVCQRTNIVDGLIGAYVAREPRVLDLAVGMFNLGRLTSHAGQRVEYNETEAVGFEFGLGLSGNRKRERAVANACDFGFVTKPLIGV